jgi:hypothetical protein
MEGLFLAGRLDYSPQAEHGDAADRTFNREATKVAKPDAKKTKRSSHGQYGQARTEENHQLGQT